jgi:acetyl-CoA carboxylase carboxyltransferase component
MSHKASHMTVRIAAENGYITEVIAPEDSRLKAAQGFRILRQKKTRAGIPKKHGNIPL